MKDRFSQDFVVITTSISDRVSRLSLSTWHALKMQHLLMLSLCLPRLRPIISPFIFYSILFIHYFKGLVKLKSNVVLQ